VVDNGLSDLSRAWNLRQEKIPTRDEAGKVLDLAKHQNMEMYLLFAIGANTGLRICEMVHLKTTDYQNKKLIITRRKKRVLAPESIDVMPALGEMLAAVKANIPEGWIFTGRAKPCILKRSKGKEEVLCQGGHMSIRHAQMEWKLFTAEAGIRMRGRGIHSLRHYAVTEFYKKHRDIRATQIFAGHSSSAITEVYAHVVDMAEKINAMEPTV
jgi:integrase